MSGQRTSGGFEGLRGAIGVAALIDHGCDGGQRGKHSCDGLLRRRLVPVAVDVADDLEIGVLGEFALHALGDVVVDAGAGQTMDIEEVAAVRRALGDLADFLGAVGFRQIDRDLGGAGFGDEPVERDDDNSRIAGLLHGAVEGFRRRGVEHDGVVALQNEILDLRGLGRRFLVGGRERVGGADHFIAHRLPADLRPALQHAWRQELPA